MPIRLLAYLLAVLLTVSVFAAVGCGDDEETTTTAAPASTETTAADGEEGGDGAVDGAEVFATNCSGCHGSEGKGASGPDLTPLTDGDLDMVVGQVTNGGSVMPAFGDKLSMEQIDAVAAHVVGLE